MVSLPVLHQSRLASHITPFVLRPAREWFPGFPNVCVSFCPPFSSWIRTLATQIGPSEVKMKTLLVMTVLVMFVSAPSVVAQSAPGTATSAPSTTTAVKPSACASCAAAASSREVDEVTTRPIPGTNETIVVGQIETLIPIGVLTVLGCEKCSAEAVNWALQQGSSFEDVERTLRTVAAMQKLDCFKSQFGPEVNIRMEKPLAAAKEALAQARTRAAK